MSHLGWVGVVSREVFQSFCFYELCCSDHSAAVSEGEFLRINSWKWNGWIREYIYTEHFDKLSHPALKKGETVYRGHCCHHIQFSYIRLVYARPASLLPRTLPWPPPLGGHTPSPSAGGLQLRTVSYGVHGYVPIWIFLPFPHSYNFWNLMLL